MTAPARLEPTTTQSAADPDDAPAAGAAPQLSLKQIIASALAAVSTTVLLSYFGIAGTIIGAGAASVLTVLANYLYTRSIEKTHERIKPVVCHVLPLGMAASAPSSRRPGGVRDETKLGPAPLPEGDGEQEPARNAWLRLIDKHGRMRVLAVSAGVLFVLVMGVVLVLELVIGKPLASAVTGQEGSGTTIGAGVSSRSSDTTSETTDGRPGGGSGDESGRDPGTQDDPVTVPDEPTEQPTDEPGGDVSTTVPTPQEPDGGTESTPGTGGSTGGGETPGGTGGTGGDQQGTDGGDESTTPGTGAGTSDVVPGAAGA